MTNPIIRVNNLSKRYRIGAVQTGYKTFREAVMEGITAPIKNFGRLRRMTRFGTGEEADVIWALKDVSFEVNEGEVLGIIGRNGAGKSTLLKILTRITEPTSGSVELYGRVSSLLEVGTGFHPELTGRENIFLNGAVLGMTKKEIERKFDEIVAFSEIEKFIDTPVKRYSSGMYVRLAFAVAAHLEPDILLVDEVLAVGDAAFQKKCLGKMEDIAHGGRTVLFVSHNMASVQMLCSHAILLRDGALIAAGTAADVVNVYTSSNSTETAEVAWDLERAPGDDVAKIKAIRVLDETGRINNEHYLSKPVTIEMDFWCFKAGVRLNPNFHIFNIQDLLLFSTINLSNGDWGKKQYSPGLYRSRCTIPGSLLNAGHHKITAFLLQDVKFVKARVDRVVAFNMNDDGSSRGDYTGDWAGAIRPDLKWVIEPLTDKPKKTPVK